MVTRQSAQKSFPLNRVLQSTICIALALAGSFAVVLALSAPAQGNPGDTSLLTEETMRKCIYERARFQDVCRLITKDKLPVLQEMLADKAYAPYWHNVARVIGYVSDDPDSVGVLLGYVKRGPTTSFSSIDSLAGKIWTLVFVGKIGGPVADSVLRKALTEEGAAALAMAWIDGPLVADTGFWDDKNSVVTYIRSCAANGLVLSRKPENIDIVKRLYADCKAGREKNGLLEQHLLESLAINDFITDNSVEAYLSLYGNAMIEALDPFLKEYQSETRPPATDSEPNKIGPRIEFESEVHDFGQVPPGSKNTCEFKFRNTGDAMLSFGKIQTTCGCTVASLKKKEYAPGESGTITTTFTASKRPSEVSKRIYVNSNDKTRPRVSLTIKASIVLWVNPEPDELSLLLKTENAGCPNITLTSIDGQPFAIKSISSPGNWLRAGFDPTVQTVKFVLEPKVDMEGLKGTQRGLIKIAVTHPKCDVVQIPYKFLPRFNISPTSIILRSVQPGAPVEKVLWISSNYNEDFEIESFSCVEGTARVVSEHEDNHRVKMQVEITPPPLADKVFFRDELHINVQDGEQFKVDVRGFYKMDKERRRPTRARRR